MFFFFWFLISINLFSLRRTISFHIHEYSNWHRLFLRLICKPTVITRRIGKYRIRIYFYKQFRTITHSAPSSQKISSSSEIHRADSSSKQSPSSPAYWSSCRRGTWRFYTDTCRCSGHRLGLQYEEMKQVSPAEVMLSGLLTVLV